ncbi:hypothetical protein AGDE_12217 [Angomonas deanei]|nr:hypothetical protein AGDE_12217 [Angomonas deanei]|eukprot:EPY24697.1 hypothetical protein AGDE_12217 [Angomonas deanei]
MEVAPSSGEILAVSPVKLYVLREGEWKEICVGEAKFKRQEKVEGDASAGYHYRLLVRDGYSLNALVTKGSFMIRVEKPKMMVFLIPSATGAHENYTLKFNGSTAEASCALFLKLIKESIE